MKAYIKGIPICSKPLEPHKVTSINCVCGIPYFLRSLFVEILRTPSALCEKYSLVGVVKVPMVMFSKPSSTLTASLLGSIREQEM